MEVERKKAIAIGIAFLVVATISFFWISNVSSDVDNFDNTMSALEDKSTTVMELAAGSTAASAAISLIPGDAGTPIADKLVDLTGYFLIILSAIMVEKWLIAITGFLAFKIVIPICCLVLIVSMFCDGDSLKNVCIKLICFALMAFAVVPASVVLSETIDNSYKASIEQTIQDAENNSQTIQEKANDKDKNALEKFLSNIKGGVSGQIDKFETVLSQFIESVAVLLVTTCLIPIAVMAFFVWLIKLMIGIDIQLPDIRLSRKINKSTTDI